MKLKYFFRNIANKKFLISISCLMLVQSILYEVIRFFQHDIHFIYSSIDNFFPFIPYFIYIYNIFYPFVFIILYYVFCQDEKTYDNGIKSGILGYLICYIIYIIYPTMMIRPYIDYSKIDFLTGLIIKITYGIDNPPLNCFPSIHCLFSFQVIITTYLSKNISKTNKIIIYIISFLIILSTLLVKQHYFYDVIGALVVCLICNLIIHLIAKKKNKLTQTYFFLIILKSLF